MAITATGAVGIPGAYHRKTLGRHLHFFLLVSEYLGLKVQTCFSYKQRLEWHDQWEGKCPVSMFCLGVGGWMGGCDRLSYVISLFDGHSRGEPAFILASVVLLAKSGHQSCRAARTLIGNIDHILTEYSHLSTISSVLLAVCICAHSTCNNIIRWYWGGGVVVRVISILKQACVSVLRCFPNDFN